jgi:Membrane bound beta barrel domain (DUF5777)
MRIDRVFLLFIITLLSVQPEVTGQAAKKSFSATREGMMQSVDLPYEGEFYFILGHRFGSIQGGLYDMFGLDLATIRLGFDYGISDRLVVGIGRSSYEKTYDLFGKMAIARQSDKFPLSLTACLANSFNTLKDIYPAGTDGAWERMSFSAQVIVARRLGKLSVQASPLFFRNNFDPRAASDLNLFALPLTASIKVSKRFSINSQYIPVFNSPDFAGANPLSVGLDIDTGGHQFQLIFSNNQGLFDKAVLTDTQGSWKTGNIFFGFNLVRVFYLKDNQKS